MGRSSLIAVVVTTVSTTGCADDPADRCTACVDRPPSAVFVTDRATNAILRYDGVTGTFEGTFAQGAEQRIDRPAGVRLGPSGHIYLAGFGRGEVVRFDVASGQMHDVFYGDTTLLEEPMDLAFRGDDLLVLGNDTRNVVVLDRSGAPRRELGWPTMRAAQDLVMADDGRTLFVATESHPDLGSAIQVWDVETGALLRHFAPYHQLAFASAIALRDDGTLYAADWERGTVVVLDASSGEHLGDLVSGLSTPTALELGPDSALYVLDATGLRRFDPDTGRELAVLVEAGDGHLVRPRGFTFATDVELAQAIARTR